MKLQVMPRSNGSNNQNAAEKHKTLMKTKAVCWQGGMTVGDICLCEFHLSQYEELSFAVCSYKD